MADIETDRPMPDTWQTMTETDRQLQAKRQRETDRQAGKEAETVTDNDRQ